MLLAPSSFAFHLFICARLLPFASQLIFQDERHDNTYYTDHQPAKEGIPPDGVADRQPKAERLTDDTRQPEEKGIDHQREQAQCQ